MHAIDLHPSRPSTATSSKRRLLIAASVATLAIGSMAGCGNDSPSADAPSPIAVDEPSATAAAASVPGGAVTGEAPFPDPCTLAATDDVSSIFSVDASEPEAGENAIGPECAWTWLDPVQGPCAVMIGFRKLSTFDYKTEQAEDISGVGEAAYREPRNDLVNNISVRKNGTVVYVSTRCNADGTNGNDGFTTQRQDTLNAFARTVVENL